MEPISNILKKMPISEHKELARNTGLRISFTSEGKPFISKYHGAKLTVADKVKIYQTMLPFFTLYNINETVRAIYVTHVIKAEFTIERLSEALESISEKWTAEMYKPTPADVVKFDREDTVQAVYSIGEMFNICKCMMNRYYDMNEPYNIYHSESIYHRCRDKFFLPLCKGFYILTDKGKEIKAELEYYKDKNPRMVTYYKEK